MKKFGQWGVKLQFWWINLSLLLMSIRWRLVELIFRPFRSFDNLSARLLLVPRDLRTADATKAADIYAGSFLFSGQVVETGGRSPFAVMPPSLGWGREAHGFGWLRHLNAAHSRMAQQNARAHIDDWIRLCAHRHKIGWEAAVAARRIISWLSQSPLIITGCNREFYRGFMRATYRHLRHLRRIYPYAPKGLPRLEIAQALVIAGLAIEGQSRHAQKALGWLIEELKEQILQDGGHISRNPGILIEILIDLLAVRAVLLDSGRPVPSIVADSIDRMMAMLRFFRMGDGSLAHFNGTGLTPSDELAEILSHDNSRIAPTAVAPHSGYHRLSAGQTVLLVDSQGPPPMEYSAMAHAGGLSFELTSRRNWLIVNCGATDAERAAWHRAARITAAHSTAEIDGNSSAVFLDHARFRRFFGAPALAGKSHAQAEYETNEGEQKLAMRYEGFVDSCNIIHERILSLENDGLALNGIDRFLPAAASWAEYFCDIRFHLHPSTRASALQDGAAILLVFRDGETWEFSATTDKVSIEESVYLANPAGHRRSQQIVVRADISVNREISWRLVQTQLTAHAQPQAPPPSANLFT